MTFRRYLFLAFPLFLLCSYYINSESAQGEPNGPRMLIKEREFDFKKVKEGQVIEHTFQVLNQGDQTLEIENVKPG